MRLFTLLALLALCKISTAQNQVPVISNLNLSVGSGQVTVTYDLADNENNTCDVKLLLSVDGGQTYIASAGTITGDVGFPVSTGTGKQIVWNYDTVSNVYAYAIRLVADDRQVPTVQQLVDMVDSVRLRNDLQFIQGIRHYLTDSAHLQHVRDTIEHRFASNGLETRRQNFTKAGYLGQNIIGRKPGLGKESKTYIIDAHFDSVDDAPGADDNGSGVVGVLEALRVLAPYNFNKTIRFIGFDFEETVGVSGTEGSYRYAQNEVPAWEDIEGVANFEMIGYYTDEPNTQQVPAGFNILFPDQYNQVVWDSSRGNFVVNVGDAESVAFNKAYDSLTQLHVPGLKIVSFNLPGDGFIAPDFRRSDHANFWDIDVPAVMLTDGANFRNQNYHTPYDTLGALNFTFMSNIVKSTVATIATLAELQHSSYKDIEINPVAIPKNNIDCEISLYPVPVKNMLYLQTGDCLDYNFNVRIMNLEGKILPVNTIKDKSITQITTDNLSAGVYFVVLETTKGYVVRKFMKE